jgi:hypothetical protein
MNSGHPNTGTIGKTDKFSDNLIVQRQDNFFSFSNGKKEKCSLK